MNQLFNNPIAGKYRTLVLALFFMLTATACRQESVPASESLNDFTYLEYSIDQLQKGYDKGDFSIEEVTRAYLSRIEVIDRNGPHLRSIIQVNPDAIAIAAERDRELREGKKRGPMHGIPVVLKDNLDTHDNMETTAGSRALKGSHPLKDSYVAQKLRESGAIILGKANLSEWANFRGSLSSSGWSGVGGQTKNPYVLDRNPCGSSSGSAVAVSANLSVLAIGTETNGSIVCPSSANGIVGIKPTVGLVSRTGVIPISNTQDTPGPMARSVRDAAICLGALTGVDTLDEKTLVSREFAYKDYTAFLKEDGLKGKRLGIYTAPLGNHYKVDSLFDEAVEFIKSQGAEVVEIDQIAASGTGQHSFQVMLYEYKHGLNEYFRSLGQNAPVKSLEALIAFNRKDTLELRYYNQQYLEMAREKGDLSSPEYQEALEGLMEGSREQGIDRVMQEHNLDAFIAPTGSPAWKTDLVNGDSFHLGSSSPAAWAGYPNITVPMGTIHGLPVGISFFGTGWSEPLLLEIAYSFEQGTLHRKPPEFLEKIPN